MPNRIIDQTEKTTIDGTESIPGTEQTSTGETVPKNKRWTFNTIKTWLRSDQIVKIDFAAGGSYVYSAARYEMVKGYVRVFGALANETIQIENNFSAEEYVPTTDASCGDFNFYSQASAADVRKLKITLSAAGTVYLFITKSLIP